MPDCPAPPACPVSIEWLIRRDMPEALAIDAASHATPWGESTYLDHLRRREVIGMVARATDGTDGVLGSMLYRLGKADIDVFRFAVHPAHRRMGIGRQMAGKLIGKLSAPRRTAVRVLVPEGLTRAHLFWRSQGFLAVAVERGAFDGGTEDGYRFVYELVGHGGPSGGPDEACEGSAGIGREGAKR